MTPTNVPERETPAEEPHDPEHAASSWEQDETRTTLFLRAVSALIAGSLLLWSQNQSRIDTSLNWNQWVQLSVIANFLLPLGIVWMFFGQGLSHPDWLKDQKYNAWSYGWSFREWRRHLKIAFVLFAAMLPVLWFASRDMATRSYYQTYFPPVHSPAGFIWLIVTLVIYMFCWEWFHRGFLLFGMAQGFTWVPAIVLQALIFGAAHYGKPGLEFYSSFAGGIVLGGIAWREKSFAPAFYTHALVHIAWAILILF